MDFEITGNASSRIAYLLQKENENKSRPKKLLGLRVSVDGGGCSGFMYNYELIDNISDDDLVINKSINNSSGLIKEVNIIIDPLSYQFLKGCTLDFVEELGTSYFQIVNPSAISKCGCGSSFSV